MTLAPARPATPVNPCKLETIAMGPKASRFAILFFAFFAAFSTAATAQTNADATDKAAADLVAAQLREQGYACEDPASAKRDPDSADAYGAIWIVSCKNASYRVQLVPDMAAEVEQIN
jgi:hypothetical protein